MSAEIPDGWVWINSYAGAATDLLILPATPGVAHVIDALELGGYVNQTTSYGVILVIKENGVVAVNQAIAGVTGADGTYHELSDSWTGPWAGASGAEVRITITSSAPAGANQVFKMRGHAV